MANDEKDTSTQKDTTTTAVSLQTAPYGRVTPDRKASAPNGSFQVCADYKPYRRSRLSVALVMGVFLGVGFATSGSFLSGAYAGADDKAAADAPDVAVATFAGGCFWCMEPPFDELPGVKSTISGYAGGHVENPTYRQVTSGATGHTEVVQVTYDPSKVSYATLLEVFWKNIDPTVENRQFCDVGSQYRSAIFYHSPAQKSAAKASFDMIRAKLKTAGKGEVHTQLAPFDGFYPAEGYHQDYYQKNPVRYKFYRYNCGRDKRLEEIWGETD